MDMEHIIVKCNNEFTGRFCEVNIDDCASQPCYNGGTCHDQEKDYTCSCPPGYFGLQCQEEQSSCNGDDLQRPVHVQEQARTGPVHLPLPDGLHRCPLQQHPGPLRRQSLLQFRPVRPAETGSFQMRLPGRMGRSALRRIPLLAG